VTIQLSLDDARNADVGTEAEPAEPSGAAPGMSQPSPIPQGRSLGSWLVWLSLPVAAGIVGYAFYYAAHHDNMRHFNIFWIGMLVFMVPAAIRLLSDGATRTERLQITAAWGLFAFTPKFFRDPGGPLWYDELAHWLQVENIHDKQAIYQSNPLIPELKYFPGLHIATDALREFTGASTFVAGTTLLALLHLSAVIGVFFIAERLWKSPRVGGIAAIIYALNPGFMIFDSQFAYESLGIVFFIWAVAALVAVQTSSRGHRGWVIVGAIVIAGCAPTHHLSSYAAAAVVLLAAIIMARRKLTRAQTVGTIALVAAAVASNAAWFFAGGSSAIGYLGPHVGGGLSQVFALFDHPHGTRKLFERSMLPKYERAAAFLAPPITALGVAVGLRYVRRLRDVTPSLLALAVLAFFYFAAIPFFLTTAGNEGARRSLDFSYLGVAIIVAPVAVLGATRWKAHVAASSGTRWYAQARRRALAAGGALGVAGVILLLGNAASGFNAAYRFPGPFIYGSDTRSQTAEMYGMVDWFRSTQGTDRRMIVDRYNGMIFAARGRELPVEPSTAFPAWQLYFRSTAPPLALLKQLSESRDDYIVVDERMAQYTPLIGIYFSPNEPLAQERTRPLSRADLAKFRRMDWARNIYSSDTLKIYRVRISKVDLRGHHVD
jgi:hypothetical protein